MGNDQTMLSAATGGGGGGGKEEASDGLQVQALPYTALFVPVTIR